MLVSEFITQYIHPVLTQRGLNLMYSQQALIDFINLGLNDIYTYEGRTWSFMYSFNVPVTPTGAAETYVFDTGVPLLRIHSIYDNKYKIFHKVGDKLKNNTIAMEYGELFFEMHKPEITFADNDATSGFIISYTHTFNKMTAATDVIPVPDIFHSALMLLVLSYVYPGYGQFGEGKDVQADSKGMARLAMLAKIDSVQTPQVTSNIK